VGWRSFRGSSPIRLAEPPAISSRAGTSFPQQFVNADAIKPPCATTLAAAVGYKSGAQLVNIGIYSDAAGTVGTLLPGGQSGTADIPNNGECCDVARVRLPGNGVALAAGVQYWLVARPDNLNGPDFYGSWHFSTTAFPSYEEPGHFLSWSPYPSGLFAAEIRGTSP
jgi:hypothetical protein